MKTDICTTQDQSTRLLKCGVSADTADMARYVDDEVPMMPWDWTTGSYGGTFPAWSLSRLLSLLPFKIPCGNFEFRLNVAPINFGTQWCIGYYCTEKPRTIKGLKHTESLIECAVQEIEWLSDDGYKLKGGTDGED